MARNRLNRVKSGSGNSPMSQTNATHPFARFDWMLSLRYLRARRKEGFISVIAGFSFLGIMLGVAMLVTVMAVLNGFRQELLSKMLGLDGHLVVQPLDAPLTDWEQVTGRIAQVPGVVLAAPFVEGQALASSPSGSSGVMVRGMRAGDLARLPSLVGSVRHGSFEGFDAGQGVAIGHRLADRLSIGVGDNVTLVAPKGPPVPWGMAPRIKVYKIVSIFKIGMSQYDATFVFMPLA